jgi:amino acid adenylation domain-containing protein
MQAFTQPYQRTQSEGTMWPLPNIRTLVDLLQFRATNEPDALAYTFLVDGDADERSYTYAQLDWMSSSIGRFLVARYRQKERVLLLLPPCIEYIAAFFGCLYAGMIAVPAPPPSSSNLNRSDNRLKAIAADCDPVAALTLRSVPCPIAAGAVANSGHAFGTMQWHCVEDIDQQLAVAWQRPVLSPSDIAFLQYTSGSTTRPQGVMVRHSNVLHNEEVIRRACSHTAASTFVGWLPFYHDMGLIGNIVQPLYIGARSILLSPAAFLTRPIRWLRAVSRYRGHTSGGPNFAYDLCVDRISEHEQQDLDLACWKIAFNGAEPIRHSTLAAFSEKFARCGFDRDAFYPCYGLAEATLMVTGSRPHGGALAVSVEADHLTKNEVILSPTPSRTSQILISSGTVLPEQEIAIVSPTSGDLIPPAQIGEILVSGNSVAAGYWSAPEETKSTFHASVFGCAGKRFLRTGDLGFLQGDHLFVTGRLKDLIVIRGVNHYPQDIEAETERAHKWLQPGGGAAFAITVRDQERLVVVQEVKRAYCRRPLRELSDAIGAAIVSACEVEPYAIVLIPPRQLPRTSSGKVRRKAARDMFVSGGFHPLYRTILNLSSRPVDNIEISEERFDLALERAWGEGAGVLDRDVPLKHLGLDSLRKIQLLYELEEFTQGGLPTSLKIENHTIHDLYHLALGQSSKSAESQSKQSHSSRIPSIQLSIGQRAIWFLQQLAPHSTAYNICRAIRVKPRLDESVLRAAVAALCKHHQALTTTFLSSSEGPVMGRVSEPQVEVEVNTGGEQSISGRLKTLAALPMQLETGPLFRVNLIRHPKHDYLAITCHHIVSDLWSFGTIITDLFRFYANQDMPVGTAQYDDVDYSTFVQWQSHMIESPEGEMHRIYWSKEFNNLSGLVTFPGDGLPFAMPTFEGSHLNFRVPESSAADLRLLSRKVGVSLFTVLLAAFRLLLFKYTDQEDAVIGVPCAGRTRREFLRTVGYFANVLPIRIPVSDGVTFEMLLQKTERAISEGLRHQDWPLHLMINDPKQAMRSMHPLPFRVLFGFLNFPQTNLAGLAPLALGQAGGSAQIADLQIESVGLRQEGNQFDISLFAADTPEGIDCCLEYDTSLYQQVTVNQLADHFCCLLQRVAGDRGRAVGSISPMTTSDRKRLVSWNTRKESKHEGDVNLVQLIEEQCKRNPAAIAVSDEEDQLSYSELNSRANGVARELLGRGFGVDSAIGVAMERSVLLEVVLLAIWKIGAAFVPLDPRLPSYRVTAMTEGSGVQIIVTSDRLLCELPESVRHMSLTINSIAGDANNTANLNSAYHAEQAAYILFTSGSTGTPKGVLNTHKGIRNRLLWMQDTYPLGLGDRVLQKTSYGFDVSVWEFFWPLMAGAEVVMARPGGQYDSSYMSRTLAERSITTVHFVPSQLRSMLLEPKFKAHSLRQVFCSGEALSRELVDDFLSRFEGVALHNLYGPTEAAIDVTAWNCRDTRGGAILIGRPISNTQIHIIDGNGNLTPPGIAGELCIAGAGVARGYGGRPDLTAERFVPNPFANTPGERMYRTGDVGRWTPNGTIQYIGRNDSQLKIRGMRVEPDEIAAVIRQYPGIQDVAVLATGAEPQLIAFLVCESDQVLGDCLQFLRLRLPAYMVPARAIRVSCLPRSLSGKLDRAALEKADPGPGCALSTLDKPRTFVESKLVPIWEELLKTKQFGIHDSFFDLGGHSLLATQLVSRLRDEFGVDIPVGAILKDVFTVERLGALVEHQLIEGNVDEANRMLGTEPTSLEPQSFAAAGKNSRSTTIDPS